MLEPVFKVRMAIVFLVAAISAGLVLYLFVVMPALRRDRQPAIISSTPAILRQVQGLSQLVTVKYVLEKVILLEDVKWYGESRVLMVAHGVVKAGVDFQKMQAKDLTIAEGKVRVVLPAAVITDVYLDDKATKVIERTTGLLRSFDKDLEQNARQQAVENLRLSAKYGGILKDAEERARGQLTALFQMLGYGQVDFLTESAK